MDQLRGLLQTALMQRLGEHLQAEVGPLTNLPNVQNQDIGQRAISGLRLGTMLPRDVLDTLGLAREGLDYGAKALTGGVAQEVGGIQSIDNPAVRALANSLSFLLPGGPVTTLTALAGEAGRSDLPSPLGPSDFQNANTAFTQDQGNIFSKLRAANEGLAQESPLATGILNQALDPLSYATGGGTAEARAVQQAGRISRGLGVDLNTVNSILFPEQHLIGAAAGKVGGPAKGVLDQTGLTEMLRQRYALPTVPEPADLATYAQHLGLPALENVPNAPSDLVPRTDNIMTMARKAAVRNAANAQPALFDLAAGGAQQARLLDDRLQPLAIPVADLPAEVASLAAAPAAEPIALMRDLLQSGDSGKGMVYAPSDPRFWAKRTGVDPATVPALLGQLQKEGALATDQSGELVNTFLAGGPRATSPVSDLAATIAPDMPGGSLELPAMPGYPGQSRADVLGTLTHQEVGQLVQLAYRNTAAQKYALARYPNPIDLAGAAIDRIQGNNTLIQNLSANLPDLAGKLAYLPDFLTPQGAAPAGGGVLNWLTKSPVAGAPQLSRLGIAGSGGVIGAAAGGLLPAETDEQRRIHALQGGALGAALGLGATTQAGQSILKALPVAKEFGGELLGAANQAQRAAMDRPSAGIANLPALAKIWRVQSTSTLRNLLQDEGTARLWNANAGVRQAMMNENWSSLIQLYNLGQRSGYDAMPAPTTQALDKWGLTGRELNIGASFNTMNQTMIKEFSAIDLAKAEAIFAGLNPAQGGVPLAGAALGAVKGYTRAWQESLFSTLNEFTRLAARHAAFQDEFNPAVDVAARHFVASHGLAGILDPAAGFSPADVGQAAGQAAQDEWTKMLDKAVSLGEQRANDIHGNFTQEVDAQGRKSVTDRAAGLFSTVVPFSSWALKAYPRTAAMMLDHPGVSLAIMLLTLGQAGKAQQQGRANLIGGVAIDKNTPFVGGLADKMLGGSPGQAYVNLLGSLTPVSTTLLQSPDEAVNANIYQKAASALDRAGFQFNPLIQAGAYAANKDYQKPSPLSRTAGLEMAMPGPMIPSLAAGPLNAARKEAGGSVSNATPEDRKLAELFYLMTGHALADPSNQGDPQRAALLASTLDPHSPIRQLAAQSTGQANVARNLTSLVSPVSVTAAPTVEQQAEAASYAARHAPPATYDPRTINALMNSGNMAQYIEAIMRQRANVGTQGEVSPLLQLTSQASGQDRAQAYLSILANQGAFGSPLIGAPTSLINQLLGLSTPSVQIAGPTGGQR